MIKELGVVREPRGLSWQNWAMACKETVANNRKFMIIIGLVVLAVAGGGLYLRHAGGGYAKQNNKPTSSSPQLNLNSSISPAQPATTQPAGDTAASALASSTTNATKVAAHTLSTAVSNVIPCNQTAANSARLTFTAATTTENAYHTAQLTLIEATGAVLKLTNPTAYNTNLANENTRHTGMLTSLQQTLASALADAHCQ